MRARISIILIGRRRTNKATTPYIPDPRAHENSDYMRVLGRCPFSRLFPPAQPHFPCSLLPHPSLVSSGLRFATLSASLNSYSANCMDSLIKLLARMGAPPLLSEGFMSSLAENSNCAPNPSFPQRKSLSQTVQFWHNPNRSNSSFHTSQAG